MSVSFDSCRGGFYCYECGAEAKVDCWPIVNTAANPEIAQSLRTGKLFEYTCPECGDFDLVTYRTLYHDVENGFLILSEPPRRKDIGEATRILDMILTLGTYVDLGASSFPTNQIVPSSITGCRGRITVHPDIQAEKARIIEAGFDDRVMELFKIHVFGDEPGKNWLYGHESVLFWGTGVFEDYPIMKMIQFWHIDSDEFSYIPLIEYSTMRDAVSPFLDAIPETYFINREWAAGVYGGMLEHLLGHA